MILLDISLITIAFATISTLSTICILADGNSSGINCYIISNCRLFSCIIYSNSLVELFVPFYADTYGLLHFDWFY